ncbi:protein-methionine-sulfoxide reductase catalytic subunit MsrP [Amorphus orientalis]|uniref:Sulfoxide reductase catalytic subunit YedY n=1 Tax=Amorphus orientalis TaxID=649198 RepID=A0AAE3VSG4_9HYPH|nr:protein-methionine-sulfoxide reductase catalytic subunit MsrP [Amorphus orientalis]MDQ0316791.1 sulfoxide reductase catalytic subunit YedY [Amorphus orientalis]
MWIRKRRGWEIDERAATPESVYLSRRALLGAAGIGAAAVAMPRPAHALFGSLFGSSEDLGKTLDTSSDPTADLYPFPRNDAFTLERPLTEETVSGSYNNFYEFGSHKQIWQAAQALPTRPWTVTIDGLVEEEKTVGIDELIRAMPLEERLYRHRCVEAWSMTVPWSGFPMKALVDYARPLGSAKYVRMETFENPEVASGQNQSWYPWPYIEGVTMAEATNELAFLVTGIYGKPAPKQFGAPLRLALPWKYGFKSAKSLVRFTFTEERPVSFWEEIAPNEYGFWANVNPEVPHRRWSQAEERVLGTDETIPTQLYNGYGEYVAGLYADKEGEKLYM